MKKKDSPGERSPSSTVVIIIYGMGVYCCWMVAHHFMANQLLSMDWGRSSAHPPRLWLAIWFNVVSEQEIRYSWFVVCSRILVAANSVMSWISRTNEWDCEWLVHVVDKKALFEGDFVEYVEYRGMDGLGMDSYTYIHIYMGSIMYERPFGVPTQFPGDCLCRRDSFGDRLVIACLHRYHRRRSERV